MKPFFVLLLLVIGLSLTACGPGKVGAASPDPSNPEATTTPEIFMPLPADQRAFEAVRAALGQQLGVDPLTIRLVKVEPVDWPDSCLGLPGEAEMCAQMITPGFRVTV